MIHLQPIKERLTYIMRILKLSLMLFIACTTMTAQAKSSAGKYCKAAVFKYDCQPGCYCTGSDSCANWWWGDVRDGCKERWDKVSNINKAGVYLCPPDFPLSLSGARSSTDCYKTNEQGMRIYNQKITCPAGKYLPKKFNICTDCPVGSYCEGIKDVLPSFTSDQGIKACASDQTTNSTKSASKSACVKKPKKSCKAGQYSKDGNSCIDCPGGYYCEGGTKGATPCPAAVPEHWRAESTYPENYYASDGEGAVIIGNNSYIPTWDSLEGKTKVTECRMVYRFKNKRSDYAADESVFWNDSTKKYDLKGTPYYVTCKPGYYMSEKLTSDYCDIKKFDNGSKKSMLYKKLLPCPPDKYCPGVKQTFCDSGTYEDTLGLKDAVKVTCPQGYYLPANTESCDSCPSDKICPGGDYWTSHKPQGAYKTMTQQELRACWQHVDPIAFKECATGIENKTQSGAPVEEAPDQGIGTGIDPK